jgi:hypothetical protein
LLAAQQNATADPRPDAAPNSGAARPRRTEPPLEEMAEVLGIDDEAQEEPPGQRRAERR